MGKLGYTSVTLTDLTQTLPVTLALKSNLDKNIQIKTGEKYEPDFTKKLTQEEETEGVIITPSLFLGQEDLKIQENEKYVNPNFNGLERKSGFIYYEIGDKIYKYDKNITTGIYVDIQGRLHIKQNLIENITIEAYIEDFEIEVHNYTDDLVSSINPITFILLEEGSNNYTAVIECTDGREFFEDTNATPIVMTAYLIKGKDYIPSDQLLYSWNKLSDGDISIDGNNQSLTVIRKEITNREYFTCTITDTTTGLIYSASQFIYDFTDSYLCDLTYDKMPLLTDKNTEITLTANVWSKDKLLENGKDGFNLSYEWFAIGSIEGAKEEITLQARNESPSFKLNVINFPQLQYQDFVVYCKVYQTDSAGTSYPIAGGTLNIHYTVQYNVKIAPQTIFIPTSYGGIYQGNNSKKYNFTFQLLDSNGDPILYESNKNSTQAGAQNDGALITLTKQKENEWDFLGEIDFSDSSLWEEIDVGSRTYEFTYVYLGQEFTEEINIVKSYAGEQGFSGYTIDLSNNFHAFSGGESIADPNQIVTTDVSAYYGDNNLEILEIKLQNNNLIIYDNNPTSNLSPVVEKNLTISARALTENSVRITMQTGSRGVNATTEGNTLTFLIKVKKPEKNENITVVKTFTYIINYEGKSYYLNTDYNNIIYSEALGSYEPSPTQGLTVYGLYRGETGEVLTYENGKIIYSLDDGATWYYLGASGKITNYSNLKNIQIRLYGSASTVDNNPNDLEGNKNYLYDMETIPILTSLEGYEIGGENLLKNTKKMTISESLWSKSNNVEINSDESFAIAMFSNEEANYLFSPLSDFDKDFINEQFCLSFLAQSFNWNSFGDENSYFIIQIKLYDENKEEKMYKEIAFISKNNNFNLNTKEDYLILPNQNWISFYKVFSFKDFNFSENVSNFNIEDIKFFSCNFYARQVELLTGEEKDKLQIKKIKIEKGNIPTEWTSNSEDSNSIIEDIQSQLAGDSAQIDTINQSLVTLTNNQLTFGQSENIKFSIITGINEDKTLSTEETEDFKPIEIMGANGQSYSFLSVQDFKKYIDDLNSSNAQSFADYSTVLINSNLEEYKNSIKILPATKDNPQGFISIQTSFWDTNSGKEYSEALKLTSNKLSFIENKNEVAYLSQNKLYIKNAQITESLIFGKDEITGDEDSHLKVIVSDNGVGFIWEVLNNG